MFIGEVCLETNDVIKLADFYRKILDIPSESKDEVHQFIITEGTTFSIYNNGSKKNNQNENISLAFTVENVDDSFKKLLELGVEIIEPPTTRPWGARNMHFRDPDGNHIYFRTILK